MPELPEVETVRRTLRKRVVGLRVDGVTITERRLRRPIPADFAARLTGRTIAGVSRIGKYLLFELDNGAAWLAHLGMTGCLTLGSLPEHRHAHVRIRLSDGNTLVYDDPRRFGLMRIARACPPRELSALGVDPLSGAFTAQCLRRLCRGRRKPIKNLLMDQRVVAGIGNIYASEILFRARVRPSRLSGRLTAAEIAGIHAAARTVLREAIALGGSSVSDYRDGAGRKGRFQLRLGVYGRAGRRCRRCRAIIRSLTLAGRASFYCPRCQR